APPPARITSAAARRHHRPHAAPGTLPAVTHGGQQRRGRRGLRSAAVGVDHAHRSRLRPRARHVAVRRRRRRARRPRLPRHRRVLLRRHGVGHGLRADQGAGQRRHDRRRRRARPPGTPRPQHRDAGGVDAAGQRRHPVAAHRRPQRQDRGLAPQRRQRLAPADGLRRRRGVLRQESTDRPGHPHAHRLLPRPAPCRLAHPGQPGARHRERRRARPLPARRRAAGDPRDLEPRGRQGPGGRRPVVRVVRAGAPAGRALPGLRHHLLPGVRRPVGRASRLRRGGAGHRRRGADRRRAAGVHAVRLQQRRLDRGRVGALPRRPGGPLRRLGGQPRAHLDQAGHRRDHRGGLAAGRQRHPARRRGPRRQRRVGRPGRRPHDRRRQGVRDRLRRRGALGPGTAVDVVHGQLHHRQV
ncbi:MAG: SpoIID, partial [uncultured Nocardioides sp.]